MSKKKNKKIKRNKTIPENESVLDNEGSTSTENNDSYIEMEKEKYAYVNKDIRKITLYVSLLIVLLVGFFFIGEKTALLNNFGDWVYKVLNITAV